MKQVRKWMQLITVIAAVIVMGLNAQAAVKINKKSAVLIKGQKIVLKVTGTDKKVKWSSTNKKVATVNSKGKITARSAGSCTEMHQGTKSY